MARVKLFESVDWDGWGAGKAKNSEDVRTITLNTVSGGENDKEVEASEVCAGGRAGGSWKKASR